MSPMEGRGVVCEWNRRLGQLVMHSAAQMPHINRAGLAECLGVDQGAIRVIAPDVGGGFGYKGILLPEEVCLAWLCRRLGRPVRWIEDRREQLSANANCREHHYDLTLYADAKGKILGIDCEATVDSGAYSSYPFSACLEAAQVGSILPGPYKMERYRCRTWSVATNKAPILPYRGVARTGVCFALETDDRRRRARARHGAARDAAREPGAAGGNAVRQHHEEALRQRRLSRGGAARREASIDVAKIRKLQREESEASRRIGVGFAIYCEQAAHGTSVYYGWGIPMVPGHEQCAVRASRPTACSSFASARTRTARAWRPRWRRSPIRDPRHRPGECARLIHGDTALTPYSTGTWGSRCMVMSGGAVAAACDVIAGRREGNCFEAPGSFRPPTSCSRTDACTWREPTAG